METIYYGHVPPVRDWQPSKGCPRAALSASRGDRNNIPYKYRQRLKPKVQNVIISIKDSKDIKELIKQVIKVDNRIYQSKKARKELGRLP